MKSIQAIAFIKAMVRRVPPELGRTGAIIAALTGVVLCLWGCFGTPERVAGGTIETTNGLTARVVLPSGKPASHIKLFLLDEKDWLAKVRAGQSIVLDSAETDSIGKFNIKCDTTATASLMANVEDYGILIHDVTQKLLDKDYQGKIGLRHKVTYQGTVKDSTYAKKIFLAGTPYVADVDSNGSFTLPDVPQEEYSVVILRAPPQQAEEYVAANQVKLDEFTGTKPDTLAPDTSKTLLVEDFNDADNRNILGTVLGGGYWDAYDDFNVGGNSALLQPANAADGNFGPAVKDGGTPERLHALQVLYTQGTKVGQEEPFPFVTLELHIGSQGTHYNLSGVDTISFYAKGAGKLVVELVQSPQGVAMQVKATAAESLTGDWQKFSIVPANLTVTVPYAPDNFAEYASQFQLDKVPVYTKKPTTWAETGGMITTIRFLGTGGSEYWLDDIRFHGVTIDDLVK